MACELIKKIINNYSSKKILVVGDYMIDRYVYGGVVRISPEAPVPVLKYEAIRDVAGGAGNTASNLAFLGAKVYVAGVTGKDRDASVMRSLLSNMDQYCLLSDRSRCTTVKTRFISNAHHLLRVDEEETSDISDNVQRLLVGRLVEVIPQVDAVVVSDYAKGVFVQSVSSAITGKCRELEKILVGDFKPKHKHLAYRFTVVKPNLKEAKEMSEKREPAEIAADISLQLDANVVLTMGANGMLAFDKACAQGRCIPAQAKKVFDVTGAGDTVAAVLALSLASGASLFNAAYIANAAGSVVVQKPGTSTLAREELLSAIQ
ncbi:MAG: bifunctional hydroxymethylpyrimidine kinase/phosphomethylpyrimidine kinase [Candidatus Aenigmarchaeota archaeon]|nr:bifunctional hydroxymethylpyrimidine kinase/phosphomethylpyrimidine kinase [Candidatus Aenigmarchaeota archaeon]